MESLIAERPQCGTASGHHIRLLDQARPATVQLNKMFHFDRGSYRARNLLCKDLGKIAPRLRRSKEHAILEAEQIAHEFDELIEVKHAVSVIVVQRHHGRDIQFHLGRRPARKERPHHPANWRAWQHSVCVDVDPSMKRLELGRVQSRP